MGLQDWSLSDLTIGLYLIYLQQASTSAVEDVKGEEISSELIVITNYQNLCVVKVFGILSSFAFVNVNFPVCHQFKTLMKMSLCG